MTKYYVDAGGNYIGAFDGGRDRVGNELDHPDVPPGAIEVPQPPDHAGKKWQGDSWGEPPIQTQFTPLDFYDRFTPQERAAIRNAGRSDPAIDDWIDRLRLTPLVDTTSQTTLDAMAYLVSEGLVTQARADEILNK